MAAVAVPCSDHDSRRLQGCRCCCRRASAVGDVGGQRLAPLGVRAYPHSHIRPGPTRAQPDSAVLKVPAGSRLAIPAYPFPLTRSRLPVLSYPFPLTVPAYPFPLTRSLLPVPTYPFPLTPFPLTRSHLPFPVTRSHLPVPTYPFPLTRSHLPVPSYPFPLTRSTLASATLYLAPLGPTRQLPCALTGVRRVSQKPECVRNVVD